MKPKEKYKRLLFCSSFTPPVNAGGGKNAYNFARFLADKGYPVTLLSLNRRGKLPPKSRTGNLFIRRILYFNHNLFTKLLSLFIILPSYIYYVCKNDIVFIYGGNIIGYEFIILTGRLLGKKVVFRSTMLDEDDIRTIIKRSSLLRPVRKLILQSVNFYFSINPEFTKSYVDVFHEKDKVFESVQGVDTRYFHPVNNDEKRKLRNKLGLPLDQCIIISIGFLVKRKGFKTIFEILGKLDFPFLYLVLGDYEVTVSHYLYHLNEEMKMLHQMGNILLGTKIVFTGPHVNVNEYLQASDVYLLNSKREGVPNALLEAMACGKTSVVKSLKGIDQYITYHNVNSLVIRYPEEIRLSLIKLRTNNGLRKKLEFESVRTVMGKCSFDEVLNRMLKHEILQ
ncbi:MAG: glycosyltransferase family 4 protein [Bacteroidales bacterium]|nr:MAG: glycosyltransferase family 4 protein [Bacteroidales bacterium]